MAEISIADIRAKFPQYESLSDQQLADGLHQKFYPNLDKQDFYGRIGFNPEPAPAPAPAAPAAPQSAAPVDSPFPVARPAPATPAAPAVPAPATPPAPRPMPAPMPAPTPQVSGVNPIPPRPMPANATLQTGGPGAGGGMEQLFNQGILPRRYADDPLSAALNALNPAPAAPQPQQPLSDIGRRAGAGAADVLAGVLASGVAREGNPVPSFPEMGQSQRERVQQIQGQQAFIAELMATGRDPAGNPITPQDMAQLQDQSRILDQQLAQAGVAGAALTPNRPETYGESTSYQAADQLRAAVGDLIGQPDKQFDDRFVSALASGAGNMAGFIGLGLLTGFTGTAYAGAALNAEGQYRRAIAEGATEEQARLSSRVGAALGASEVIPLARALQMLPAQVRAKVTGRVSKRLEAILQNAGEEAMQEAAVEMGNNIADSMIYDPERGWTEGVLEAAAVGAVLGGGVGAAGQAVGALAGDPPATPPQEATPAPDAPQDTPPAGQAPEPDAAPEPEPQPEPAPEARQRFEIVDEVETVDGESVPTGRKLRIDYETGTVSPVDPVSSTDEREAVQGQSQDAPEVGPEPAPAADQRTVDEVDEDSDAGSDEENLRGEQEVGTIRTATLSSEEVGQVQTDATTFQYKDNGDQDGVTDRLQGITDWDERSAMGGIIYEYADGRRVVADGHQRLGLAKRLQQNGVKTPWNVEIIRETDGFTPADVRRIAALKNIREGSGTAIDAAKVLREAPDQMDNLALPPRSALVRDAKGLARLSDDAFGMAVNEVVPAEWAAAVGENVADPALHADIVALLNKLQPKNNAQAAMIARQAGQEATTETQTSLFGDEQVAQSLYKQRAQVLDGALKRLKQDRATFKVLSDRASTITKAGNVLNTAANAERVQADSEAAAYLMAEANRKGPISDALSAAAKDLKDNPRQSARIIGDFLTAIRNPVTAESGQDGGRTDPPPEESPRGSRQEVAPPTATESTDAGDQMLIPGVNPVTDKDRAEAAMNRPMRGGNAGAGSGRSDLFGNPEDRGDMFAPDADAEPQPDADQGTAGTFVDRSGDNVDMGAFKARQDELPARIDPEQLAAEAKRLTLEPGRRDGIEYLMLIDGDGQIVSYGSGHESGTGFPAGLNLAFDPSERIVAHHNHPRSSAFSPSDYALTFAAGMHAVYAHGHDGSTFEVRATPLGRAVFGAPEGDDAFGIARDEINNAYNVVATAPVKMSSMVDFDQIEIGQQATFAFMMAMKDAGLIEYRVSGPAVKRSNPENNIYLSDKYMRPVFDRVSKALKSIASRRKAEESNDRPTSTDRHFGILEGIFAADDAGSQKLDRPVSGSGQGRNPQRPSDDQRQGSRKNPLDDADFMGAVDAMFGGEAKPDSGEAAAPPSKRAKSEIAKDMRDILRGLKEDSDLFGDTPQPKRTMTQQQRAELEARAKQSKMRTSKRQDDAGPLFGQQDDLFGGLEEDAPQSLPDILDVLNNIIPGWTAGPTNMLTNPHKRGGIIDKAIGDGKWFIVFGHEGWGSFGDFETRGEAVAEYARSMRAETDPTKYYKLAPVFVEALDGIDVAAQSRQETFSAMMRPLADSLTRDDAIALYPYFARFLDDVESGRVNLEGDADAPSTGSDLESDRRDTETGNDVGGTDVSATGRPDGDRAAAGGTAPDADSGQRQGGGRVSDGDAAVVGTSGNRAGSGRERADGQPASGGDRAGSGDRGQQGLPPDDGPASATSQYATDAPSLDSETEAAFSYLVSVERGSMGDQAHEDAFYKLVTKHKEKLSSNGLNNIEVRDQALVQPDADENTANDYWQAEIVVGVPSKKDADAARRLIEGLGGTDIVETQIQSSQAKDRKRKERAERQAKADKAPVKLGDRRSIDTSLPLLLPEQRDDVEKTETRFAKPDGHGMLLTNGTGTGKTYSGGGVIKRFQQQGKTNILILAPSQGILDAWVDMGADMGIPITKLKNRKDAGTGIVATTYANAGKNDMLAQREWDLVVTDESQKLSQNANGDATSALNTVRAITNRPEDLWLKARMLHAEEWAALYPNEEGKRNSVSDAVKAKRRDLNDRIEKTRERLEKTAKRSKVLFLSATPFAYDKNVDYAEDYLFKYGPDGVTDSGSRQSGRNLFFVSNFGYRIKSHKLTKPEAAVDSGVFERQFHQNLKAQGVLSGRQLDVDADYDRKFVRIDTADGELIDQAVELMWKNSGNTEEGRKWSELHEHFRRNFNYLRRMQLLEAIKADASIEDIQAHLDLGRKVVVFHDYNVGGGFNPFTSSDVVSPTVKAMEGYKLLLQAMPEVADLNFSHLNAPIETLTKAFGKRARVYNGTISGKDRRAAKDAFNKDNSGVDILIVQSAAGEAGISLHDTTGGHQRALINLGMPVRPTTTLQQEGRIRRVGSVSDALFRYYTTGTSWERAAFAGKIAQNSGTVENLALGDEARAIRDSFISAYMSASRFKPSDGEGKGGRDLDRSTAKTSPYDQAKTHYFGRPKNTRRRDQRQGFDFYATPEPLGYKMAQWAKLQPYERALEPSAGDGAIARYLPADSDRTIIEPSADLITKAQLLTPGSKAVQERFESHHITNKYDAIVMNPPFGSGGKTAMEHVGKAARHLKVGGRIVALVPEGPAADKQLQKLMGDGGALDGPQWQWTADVSLPSVAFEKAGTSVRARVMIWDKVEKGAEVQPTKRINMTGAQKIGDFFDRLEDIDVPERPTVTQLPDDVEAVVTPAISDSTGETEMMTVTTKAGKELPAVGYFSRVDRETWGALLDVAERHGGWSHFVRGRSRDAGPVYAFRSEQDRAAFMQDVQKPQIGLEEIAYHGSPSDFDAFSLGAMGTGEGAQAFGWGMYFASERQVAEHYRQSLTRPKLMIDGQPLPDWMIGYSSSERTAKWEAFLQGVDVKRPDGQSDHIWSNARVLLPYSMFSTLGQIRDRVLSNREPVSKAVDFVISQSRRNMEGRPDPEKMEYAARIASAEVYRDRLTAQTGRIYTVDLPAADQLLDWDATLFDQPDAVKESLRQIKEMPDEAVWGIWTGQQAYEALTIGLRLDDKDLSRSEAAKLASLELSAVGIPGHRYLDGMSRNKQAGGSHNYVIYDEAAVRILSKERRGTAAVEQLQASMPDLRAELDRLNLKRVKLGADKASGRLGVFQADGAGGLEILIGASLDPTATLHHEAIHAMRAMDLFTPQEWRALEIKAARSWVEQYDIPARYPDLLPSEQIEEAIAEAFADAVNTKKPPKGSILVRAFNKMGRLIKALGNVLRGAGFQTAEDVLGRAMSGEVGARDTGRTGMRQRIAEARPARKRPSAQQQAHMATAMNANGGFAFVPDRRIFEELTASNAGVWQRLRNGAAAAHDWIDKGRIKIQDRFLPVLRAQEAVVRMTGKPLPEGHNAYLTEETFSGKVGRHLFEIDEEYTKPIIDIMGGKKGEKMLDADYVGTWLYARHAIERNERIASINPNMPDGGSGMTDAEAQQILAIAAAGPNAARLQEIAKLIDDLRERTLALREDAGLITPEEAQLWRVQYEYYVPLKGFADTDHSEAMLDVTGVGRRFNTRGPESKLAMGRQSSAFNPLQAAITQAQEVAIRAEKNRVGQALYNLARDFPSPALWSVKTPKQKRYFNRTTGLVETRTEDPISLFMDPNELAVKVDGKERRVMFHDPRLAESAGTVGADRMNWFVAQVSKLSRWFSSVNTMLDPEFVIRNAFRDMTAAQVNIRNFGKDDRNAIAKAMLKDWPKAFAGAFRGQGNKADTEWTRYYREFEKSGAKVSFWKLEQPEVEAQDMKRRIKLAHGNVAQRASKFVRISTRDNPILGFIERTNLAVDNAVRLAAYVAARKQGWTKQQAASLSKNLTVNFNRRGEWGAGINAFYPFANAGIQGTQILFRAMTSKRMAKYALGMVALGIILDQVNASLSAEDEDGELAYDKIPDWKNQMNLVAMLGPDSGTAATLWLPYGYNLFPYMGQQASKIMRGVKDPSDAIADFAAAMFGSFSPLGGRDLQSVITPTFADPINEMRMNEDWLGRPIRPENPYTDYGPDAYKYYGGVSDASKAISDVLNRATGGTIAEPGAIDISPEYIDHAFGFATGGAGRFIGRTSDTMAKMLRGEFEDIEARNIPFYRSLQQTTGSWLDRDRYYRFREEVREARDAVQTYRDAGMAVPADVAQVARLYERSRDAERALREFRSTIRAIEGRDNLTAAEKSERRAAVEQRADRVYLQFNRQFLQVSGARAE